MTLLSMRMFNNSYIIKGLLAGALLTLPLEAAASMSSMKRGSHNSARDEAPAEFIAPEKVASTQGRHYQANAKMAMYFGGLSLGDFDLMARLDGPRYRTQGVVTFRGLARFIVDGQAHAFSEGIVEDGLIKPAKFGAATPGGDENGEHAILWNYGTGSDFSFTSSVPVEGHEERRSLAIGSLDPLLLGLGAVALTGENGLCDYTLPGFEGTNRFDLVFSNPRATNVKASRYSPYEGAGLYCDIELRPISRVEDDGTLTDISDHDKQQLTLLLGKLPAPDGGDDILVPVQLRLKTMMGSFIAHLIDWDVTDTHVAKQANAAQQVAD